VTLALGPETRLKSRRPARRPRGDSYARRCDYGGANIFARRPPGTRRTEYALLPAESESKSGKAQSRKQFFLYAKARRDAGGICEYFPGTVVTAGRALCLCGDATRASRRLRRQRSAGTLCVSSAEAPGSVERSKRSGTSCRRKYRSTASGRFPKGLWGLSELLYSR
jgi:hypothetical protein